MTLTPDQITEKIEKHADSIREFGVQRLAIFGSHARGDAGPGSDLDFLVEFEKGRGLYDDYVGLLHFLEDLFEKEIELVKANLVREELQESIQKGPVYDAAV